MSVDIKAMLQSMDAPFVRFDKNKVEPIVWSAKDFYIQFKHEVKVPAIAGSIVKFEFHTKSGDISFGLQFVTSGNLTEVIRDTAREPSDVEPIRGSYKAEYDGVFIFIFDNSYSWFTDKELTYTIQLLQPAFAMADLYRTKQSRKLLNQLMDDAKLAKVKLETQKSQYNSVETEINALEHKLQQLKSELSNKQRLAESTKKELEELNVKIKHDEEKMMGLCIRCLDKKALSHMLSFLGKQSNAYITSKYWKALLDELEQEQQN